MVDPETPIRDIVVPIVEVRILSRNEVEFVRLLGTGFYLAESSVLITATHVIETKENLAVLAVINNQWHWRRVSKLASHPTEDVTILMDLGEPPMARSWLKIDTVEHYSSGRYEMWGYPEDVLYDANVRKPNGSVYQNPDLVFTHGYIRRRVAFEVPGIYGTCLFEISEVAGSGCSGGPLITRRGNDCFVSGIYLGERKTQHGDGQVSEMAYALRISAVRNWISNQLTQI